MVRGTTTRFKGREESKFDFETLPDLHEQRDQKAHGTCKQNLEVRDTQLPKIEKETSMCPQKDWACRTSDAKHTIRSVE